jgi:outer membrane murein-binding lipoprotein Lpp
MVAGHNRAVYTHAPMNRFLVATFASSLLFLACPKAAPGPNLGGSDDQKMDTIAAQLEELNTKTNTECSETCSNKTKVCNLSETACEIAGRNTDRSEYQKRCVTSQEECAKFNEACSTCKK